MDWLQRMNAAMDYIEAHLEQEINYEDIARSACCSSFYFQRMFAFITDVSLSEYIRRRRMTLAGLALQNGTDRVLDLALQYGYDSADSFSRAFQKMHGVTPTQARNQGVALKAYPRLSFYITIKGAVAMNYRIEEKEAFEVYGLERIVDAQNEENMVSIPAFWTEIMQNGQMQQLKSSTQLDAHDQQAVLMGICGYPMAEKMTGTKFPYLIGCLQTAQSQTAGYKTVPIPAGTWAVFTTEMHTMEQSSSVVQELTRRVYGEWALGSSYERDDRADLEVYKGDGNGLCFEEIWLPIRRTEK